MAFVKFIIIYLWRSASRRVMKRKSDNLKSWWALLGICLLAFVLFLDVGIVANALPAIQKTFHAVQNATQEEKINSGI
jgi:hypothetical protein